MKFQQAVGGHAPCSFSFLLALLLPVLPSPALAAPEPAALKGLQAVMGQCPQRVWPEYSWESFQVLEAHADGSAHILSSKSGTITELPASGVPEAAKVSPYAFFKLAGEPAMSINPSVYHSKVGQSEAYRLTPEQEIYDSIDLAGHEGFHRIAQLSWTGKGSARGTDLPILARPRLYRRALFDRLLEAFRNPSSAETSLAKAKFWFARWKEEFPREFQNSTDLSEGTAQYAGLITGALAKIGCGASEEELRREILSMVNNEAEAFTRWKFVAPVKIKEFALDNEGYSTGGMAAFLMRFSRAQGGWEKKAAAGLSPVELLLGEIAPEHDELAPGLAQEYEAIEAREKARTDKLLAPAISNLDKTKSVVVAIPGNWASGGTFSPHGFFNDPERGLHYIPLRLAIHFDGDESRKADSAVTAESNTVFVEGFEGSPCPSAISYWPTLVPKDAVKEDGAHFILTDKYAHGRLRAERKRASDGREWLCGF